jgi:hypothetical protein
LVFEKMILVGILVFQKITEVGNLCRAGRAWPKTGQKPKTDPRARLPGASFIISVA